MVERHIISPSAGRMRPKTSESGIFNTNRNRPVSTSILTRILVPNPKNAFQSPAVHTAGRFISDVVTVIVCSYRSEARFQSARRAFARRQGCKGEAGRPDLKTAEVHDDSRLETSGFMAEAQNVKPKPA